MKFGKVENIAGIDFSLPTDYFQHLKVSDTERAKIYTGATSWINPAWKGSLYPEKTRKDDFLRLYSRNFNSIELNATHYRTPSDKSIETWLAETPDDFRFCPKILQAISHRNDMLASTDVVNNFIVQLSKIGEKLGQCFIQLPPYFKHKNLSYLDQFLQAWPMEMALAVELRDTEMHASKAYFSDYLEVLTKNNCSPLITDVSGRRDLLHMAVNNEKVFVRWVGNGLHETDFNRIKEWILRMETWAQNGVQEIYFMLHEPENLKTPEIAEFLARELENNQYLDHRGPKLIQEPPNLFS